MATTMTLHECPRSTKPLLSRHVRFRAAALGLPVHFQRRVYAFGQKQCFGDAPRSMAWTIRSNVDGSPLDPSSANNGRTRLIKTLQQLQNKAGARIKELRKNLPMKLLFFLAGFYCATAFATVIGQTGDWDILSAALAVVVVEGIGALMYKGSLPLISKAKDLITMFNYWKAGLSLGLFLDSFKYEIDNIMGLRNLFDFEIDIFSRFF